MKESSIEIGALSHRSKLIALIMGPIVALALFYLLPSQYVAANGEIIQFSVAGKACLSVTAWMAVWWFTEALPIAITALLPIVVYPLLGIATPSDTMSGYASSTIFLFMGGFLIAAGIRRWHLDRRIALATIAFFGTKPHQMILGLMIATAFLSAWVSNTATAAMMVPIAIAVMGVVRATSQSETVSKTEHNFSVCLLLSIAYAASIGGMATQIGSPPNGIFARFVEQTYGITVSFFDWMKVGLPITLILLPTTYLLLTKVLFREQIEGIPGGKDWVKKELHKLGKMSRGEKVVLSVFFMAAALWIFGPLIRGIEIGGSYPFKPINDAVIAMGAGILLFVIPVDLKHGVHALNWSAAKETVAWDVLLLFGGGLTMVAAITKTGAAAFIGSQAASFAGMGDLSLMLGVTTLVTFATEVTSNTALAATMMPLIAAVADSLQLNPEPLLLSTALAASCAFMMPVATPPNAVVFGSGRLKITEMIKAGFWLNIIAIIVIVVINYCFSGFMSIF